MELPLNQGDLLEFIGWLKDIRKVKSATISSYLSGIRQLHILKGMEPPELRSALVKFLLKGKSNSDNIADRQSNKGMRLPMTMTMMRLLKELLRVSDMPLMDKLLMWTVSTLAFHGAFRIHELLSKVDTDFDPDFGASVTECET